MRTTKRSIQQTYLKKPSSRLSSFRHHLPSSFLAFSIIVNPHSPTNSLSKTFFQKPLTLKPRKESTSMPSSSPLNFSLFFLSFFFSHCFVPSSNSCMESLLLPPKTFLLNLSVLTTQSILSQALPLKPPYRILFLPLTLIFFFFKISTQLTL